MTHIPPTYTSISSDACVNKYTGRIIFLFAICLLVCRLGRGGHVTAQSGANPWTTPVNISRSGGASQPVIAATLDGTLHALWWDSTEGEKYAQTTTATGSDWTTPIAVAQIYGQHKLVKDPDTGKTTLVLQPPVGLQMLSDSEGTVYAFWRDIQNQLFSAQMQSADWGAPMVLADAIVGMDAAVDATGTVHVVYVRPLNNSVGQSGVYYRVATAKGWSDPILVHASLYFRTLKPEQVVVSVASDGNGQVVVAWDDPEVAQSLFVLSADGGQTWSSPQGVSDIQANPVTHAYVASAPDGGFLMVGKNATAAGCGLIARRSKDGGQTWDSSELLPSDFSPCPLSMRFSLGGDGRLWLLGLTSLEGAGTSSSLALLAAWDGKIWSHPVEADFGFIDKQSNKTASLNSLNLALAGQTISVIGTDTESDVWAARNAVTLDLLLPALKPVWDSPEMVSDQQMLTHVKDVPAVVTDPAGKLYALWSEMPDLADPGAALYLAVWNRGRWSRATELFQAVDVAVDASTGSSLSKLAEQPALAFDSQGRLHALWRGGAAAEILHSWAVAEDAASASAWSEPKPLPAPGRPASWPDLVADPRTDTLHAIYAVPYNEGRGIYYVQSDDSGSTWLTPTVVFNAVAAKWDSVDKPRLELDTETGTLHAVWLQTALVGEAYGHAVMYAHSNDGGRTWSVPLILAEGAVDWPRLATPGTGQVYVLWNRVIAVGGASAAASEVWGQFSPDNGQRWVEAERIPGLEVTGPVGLASDRAGGLYLLGSGESASGEATLVYSYWTAQTWSQPESSDLGQNAASGNGVAAALDLRSHRLSAILRELVSAPAGGGWFRAVATGREIQVSSSVKPMATLTPLPLSTPTTIPAPVSTATSVPLLTSTGMPQALKGSPLPISLPLIAGGVLILLIIFGMVAVSLIRMARR